MAGTASRLNGKKGGRPRKAPATVLGGDLTAPVPTPLPVPEVVATATETPAAVVPALDNPFDLNARELLFVEAYCGLANFNASEAYRMAGYGGKPESVGPNAGRLIKRDHIARAIAAKLVPRVARLKIMDGDEALEGVSNMGRVDIRRMFDPVTGSLLRPKDWPDDVADAVKSIAPNKYGLRVEMYDKLRARETMAKVAGRLKETVKVEITLEQIMAQANKPAELQQGTAA